MTSLEHVEDRWSEAVRLVWDVIDATSEPADSPRAFVPTERTAGAVIAALVEAGWTPPQPSTDPGADGELANRLRPITA